MIDELLPCPFCGNCAKFRPYKRDGLTLKCETLGCVSVNQRTMRYNLEWLKGKMVESWNTRATPSNFSGSTVQPEQPAAPVAWFDIVVNDKTAVIHYDFSKHQLKSGTPLYSRPAPKTQSFGEKYPRNPDAKCKCEHWEACIDCHPTYINSALKGEI